MARRTVDAQEARMNDAAAKRLERATSAVFVTSLGSAGLALVLLALGREGAALLAAVLGLGVGAPLGVALALVAEGAARRAERRVGGTAGAQGLTRADWVRAAAIGAAGAAAAAAGVVFVTGGHAYLTTLWIVTAALAASGAWAAVGRWAWADVRAALALRLVGALAAAAFARLAWSMAGEGPVVALVMMPALMGALLAAAAHGELPTLRASAALDA